MALPENQVKEELSYAFIHAIASRAGFSCDRPTKDFQSMDVQVNSEGKACNDALFMQTYLGLQLKATSEAFPDQDPFSYSLPMKNYNDLRVRTAIPKLLVVFFLPPDANKWLQHQHGEHLITEEMCVLFESLWPSSDSKWHREDCAHPKTEFVDRGFAQESNGTGVPAGVATMKDIGVSEEILRRIGPVSLQRYASSHGWQRQDLPQRSNLLCPNIQKTINRELITATDRRIWRLSGPHHWLPFLGWRNLSLCLSITS